MRRWLFGILFCLLLFPIGFVHADVIDEALPLFRLEHYESTPLGIYVNRTSGSSTSETLGYAAMLECRTGDLGACYGVLLFADNIYRGRTEDYSFPWLFSRSGTPLRGKESATDGDVSLLWAAWAAYNRTGDSVFLALYTEWNGTIQDLDICVSNGQEFLASGSGIGRWNGCNSFNGVYSAYLMLPLLADIAVFDSSWESILEGTVRESYEIATLSGNILPNRCSAYIPGSLNTSACELHTGYFDPLDAQRWILWNSIYCNNYYGMTDYDAVLCAHIATLPPLVSDGRLPSNGFWLNGTPRGNYQTNTYDLALWSALRPELHTVVVNDWNGQDFDGTPCPGNCLDEFKDALIIITLGYFEGNFFTNMSNILFVPQQYNYTNYSQNPPDIFTNETYIPSIIDTYSPYYVVQQNELSGNETLVGFTYEEIDHKKNLLLTVIIPLAIMGSIVFAFLR